MYFARFFQLDGEQRFLIDFALFSHSTVSTKARIEAAETYEEEFTNSDLGTNIRRDMDQMQFSNFTEWCQIKTAAETADIKETWTSVFQLNFLIYDSYSNLYVVSNSVLLVGIQRQCNLQMFKTN